MLSELIDRFDELCHRLTIAVRDGDETSVTDIDDKLGPILRRIFAMHAESRNDIDLQLKFFSRMAAKNSEDVVSVKRYTGMMRALFNRYLDAGAQSWPILQQSGDDLIDGYDTNLHELLLNSMPERVAVIGRDYRYIYANEKNAMFHRCRSADFVGRELLEMIGAEVFFGRAKIRLDECFDGASPEYKYETSDREGRFYNVDCRMTPLSVSGNKIIAAVVMVIMHPHFAQAE